MSSTKERILEESLKLFAQHGYEAASVRDIAAKLSLTQAALYKHYKNKQEIFDTIISTMKDNEKNRAAEYNMPLVTDDITADSYKTLSVSQLKLYCHIQFLYWTENDFAACCRRILTLEQFHNYQASMLYQQYLVSGQFEYMEKVIGELIRQGQWKDGDVKEMAMEFYAPILSMILIYDGTDDKEGCKARLKEHINRITGKYKL